MKQYLNVFFNEKKESLIIYDNDLFAMERKIIVKVRFFWLKPETIGNWIDKNQTRKTMRRIKKN